ncbi:MAG TPA: Uma2 family endonuclease [Gemmataceae bacterium]|jgi:Uma2 family endonuclease|nr:Uma2 family endonuclease [Gemmataceae bacterium]
MTVQPLAGPALPADGDLLYEVVNGERVELPPMGIYEASIACLLDQHLGPFAAAQQLGRVGVEYLFRLNPAARLQRRPDLAFVSYQRWPKNRPIPRTDAWDVVPDLATEVVSKTNLAEEIILRVQEYFQAGVQLVWVIYPVVRQVYVYESPTRIRVLVSTEELDGGTLLPGFRLPLSTLFEEGTSGG